MFLLTAIGSYLVHVIEYFSVSRVDLADPGGSAGTKCGALDPTTEIFGPMPRQNELFV
jgi:hypothetical protein